MSCGVCSEKTKACASAATGAPTATGAAVALDCALYQRSRPTEVETVTRRRIAAPPRIRLDTNRKCQNDVKKLEAWLKEQAIAEAASRGDDWNLMQFQAMKAGKLTTAEKDGANLYLFGEEDPKFTSTGTVERSRLTRQNDVAR